MRLRIGLTVLLVGAVLWQVPTSPVLDMSVDRSYSRMILEGIDPYTTGVVPRPPSAWPIQLPLAWLDPRLTAWVLTTAGVVMVAFLAVRYVGREGWLPVVGMMVAASAPARATMGSGNMAGAIALLVGWGWLRRSGWAVGLAAGLRVYPAIFAAAVKRWSAVWVTVGLTAVGLAMVPNVGWDVIRNGGLFLDHQGNTSLATVSPLLAVGVGVVLAVMSWRADFDRGMCLAACAAVLVPAVSWPGYHLVMVPAVGWAVSRRRWWVLAAVPFWFYGFGLALGRAHLVAALVVLTAIGQPPAPERRGA